MKKILLILVLTSSYMLTNIAVADKASTLDTASGVKHTTIKENEASAESSD
jgi:hypothetical protein